MKKTYIDIMEKVVGAYSDVRIEKYIEQVQQEGLREHGFPRLTANMGILIAHGRRSKLKDLFVRMMDICCEQIPTALARNPLAGNEFSVKELVPCLLALEEKKIFSAEKFLRWRKLLGTIQPATCYKVIAQNTTDRINNWAAFGAASEQARKYAGIAAEDEFIDKQIASQLLSFDENGMYRDPNEPMVYDITTRLQLSAVLYFGYNGRYREALDEMLELGGQKTLLMQSVTGEIPYGGRSNQFLHNEAVLASVMEFEAARYYKRGNFVMAGQFKAAAVRAVESIVRYLDSSELYHIKNCYPQDSFYGCERYAHFNKYMVTIASFLYLGYLFAEDDIVPTECPAETGKHIFRTSDYFHRTMLKFGPYFAEYDTNADFKYDANGLGRIHRQGAPSTLCLSMPFPTNPNYKLDMENDMPLSICWGDRYAYSSEQGTVYELIEQSVTDTEATVKWKCTLHNETEATETCMIKEDGVYLQFDSTKDICCLFPVFACDGKNETRIEVSGNCLTVGYRGWQCRYKVTGVLLDTGKIYANKNGHYRAYMAEGGKHIKIVLSIKAEEGRSLCTN